MLQMFDRLVSVRCEMACDRCSVREAGTGILPPLLAQQLQDTQRRIKEAGHRQFGIPEFQQLGSASCHSRGMPLESPTARRNERVATEAWPAWTVRRCLDDPTLRAKNYTKPPLALQVLKLSRDLFAAPFAHFWPGTFSSRAPQGAERLIW